MNAEHWKIDDLPWAKFDATLCHTEILKIIKAAALVEFGGDKYANYLCNVFEGDSEFQAVAKEWAQEEVQHGIVLGRYAQLADPQFNFEKAYERFSTGYSINLDTNTSIRGSRSGELIARCIVETGTSSYYTALAEATDEPLLKAICLKIAADELRHYKMFYTYLKKYLTAEELNRLQRLKIGLSRVQESEDDELAYAYYAANTPLEAVYKRDEYTFAYMARAYSFYKPKHVDRVVGMVFKACGLKPNTMWHGVATKVAWRLMTKKTHQALTHVARQEAA